MSKFIASLFTAKAIATPNLRTRLSLDAMEDRYAPAGFVHPGDLRGFNPQPEPPILRPESGIVMPPPEQASAAYTSPMAEAGGIQPTPFRVS